MGMLIFQFPYAMMIGTLIGFTALIPVAGAYIGAGVGAIMILTVSPVKALLFLVFIVVLQQLEGNLISSESEKILLKRFAEPSDIANVIFFLSTDKADYINGTVIKVDGGC